MDYQHRLLADRRGFTLAEVVIVVVIMGLAAAIAIPQLDTEAYKVNAAVRAVSSKLSAAQRLSVSLQHDVLVAFDAGNNRLRVHEDANNNGTIDGAERVTSHPLEDGVTFGRGGAGAHTFGGAAINFTRTQGSLPVIIFRRDGSASEYGGFYLITGKSMAAGEDHNVRAAEIVRATGKATFYRYGPSGWTPRRLMRRRGFTVIEIAISLVILSVVILGLARFAGEFLHAVGTSTTRTVAASVARERLEEVRADPTYPLPATWAGTAIGFPDYPNMTRITRVTRVTGAAPVRDYTIVSVKVTEPTMMRPGATALDTVNVTAVVARP